MLVSRKIFLVLNRKNYPSTICDVHEKGECLECAVLNDLETPQIWVLYADGNLFYRLVIDFSDAELNLFFALSGLPHRRCHNIIVFPHLPMTYPAFLSLSLCCGLTVGGILKPEPVA